MDPHGLHPGGMDGLDARLRVLKADALLRAQPKRLRAVQKDLRVGLLAGELRRVGNVVKFLAEIQLFQHRGGVAARGGDGQPDPAGSGLVQEGKNAGQDILPAELLREELTVIAVLPVNQLGLFRRGVGGLFAVPFENDLQRAKARHALEQLVVLLGKMQAELRRQTLPREILKIRGVRQDSVQVKKKTLDHCSHLPFFFHYSTTCAACQASGFLVDVVDVVQRAQRLDDLTVGLVLFQLRAADRDRHGIDAQAGIDIGWVGLDVVDAHPQPPQRGDKIAQVRAARQLQMDLEMVGTVFQIGFKGRKPPKAAE